MSVPTWLSRLQRRPIVFVFHDILDQTWFDHCIGEISSSRQVLPLEEVATRRELHTCALTFDDGRLSVAAVVHPVLRARQLPYTVFVCTDVLMGGTVPWFVRTHHLVRAIGIEPVRAEWGLGDGCHTTDELVAALKEIPFDRILAGVSRLESAHAVSPPAPEGPFYDLGAGPRVGRRRRLVWLTYASTPHPVEAECRRSTSRDRDES